MFALDSLILCSQAKLQMVILIYFHLTIKKMTIQFRLILRMNKVNFTEALNKYSNLSDQTKFRLNGNIKIEDYFNSEIHE